MVCIPEAHPVSVGGNHLGGSLIWLLFTISMFSWVEKQCFFPFLLMIEQMEISCLNALYRNEHITKKVSIFFFLMDSFPYDWIYWNAWNTVQPEVLEPKKFLIMQFFWIYTLMHTSVKICWLPNCNLLVLLRLSLGLFLPIQTPIALRP